MKTPLVAWEIDSAGYATPVVPCSPMTERWAVLTPTGVVITDEYTGLGLEGPIALKDWIKIRDQLGRRSLERGIRTLGRHLR